MAPQFIQFYGMYFTTCSIWQEAKHLTHQCQTSDLYRSLILDILLAVVLNVFKDTADLKTLLPGE
jgi:hypothetical protein